VRMAAVVPLVPGRWCRNRAERSASVRRLRPAHDV